MNFSDDPDSNLDVLSLCGYTYDYNNDSFIGYKALGGKISDNVSYSTKYKLSPSVPVSRQEFLDFTGQCSPERIVFRVESGKVVSITLVKFR